jgi:hypothetical protein
MYKYYTVGCADVEGVVGKTVSGVEQIEGGRVRLKFDDGSSLAIDASSEDWRGGGADLTFRAEGSVNTTTPANSGDSCANCGTELWVKDEGRCPACGGTES